MRTIALFIILSASSFRFFAQQQDAALNAYFQNINKAEIFIIDEDYKSASESFNQAFSSANGILFSNDLYNAFLSALYTEDYKLCNKYIDSMAYYGVSKESVTGRIKRRGKEQFLPIGNRYDSIQRIGHNNMNKDWIKRSDSFVNVDIEIRKKWKEGIDERALSTLDSINFNAFLQAIDRYGFPTFKVIGFYAESSAEPLVTNAFFLLLWHQRGAVFNDSIENKLLQYVHNGWLLPYDYVVTRRNNYAYYGLVPTNEMDKRQIEIINTHRSAIRMESIEEFKAKMHKKFKVEGISVISQIPFNFHNVFVGHTYETP